MSLARAVTKRIKRTDGKHSSSPSSPPARSQSMKNPNQHTMIDRAKISSPVALISTTNMLSYDAPDIVKKVPAPLSPITHSPAEDSDNSVSSPRSRSSSQGSRETLTDLSSVDASPISPAPNHLSGYFASASKAPRRSQSSADFHSKTASIDGVPAIPERALSHSKRAHERLAQKRSLQNIRTPSTMSRHSSRSSREQRTSLDIFKNTTEGESHPFVKELEQLNEVAEEFGSAVQDAETEADIAAMNERGLARFCAADYLLEIQPLSVNRFGNPYSGSPMAWI